MSDDQATPDEVLFTKQDLQYMREQASKFWQATDGKMQLPGEGKAISEEDFTALSWLIAAADLLYRKQCGTYIVPKLRAPFES